MKIKFRFYYRWSQEGHDKYGHPPKLDMARNINDLPIGEPHPFYLLSGALSDFNENRYGDVDATLLAIGRLECGEIDSYETGGLGFEHTLTRNYVRFEHSIFGECPEWPIWYCTLAQYKAALEGYRRFLDMPKSIDSELIVELPEGEPDVAER